MKKLFITVLLVVFSVFAHANDKETDKQLQKQLEENYAQLKTDILVLKNQAVNATGVVKRDLLTQIDNLEKDQKKLDKKIKKLKVATGKAWGEIQKGASEAYEELRTSFKKASAAYDDIKKESKAVKEK